MSSPFRLAGVLAGLLLVALGIGSIVTGLAGRSEVSDTLAQEQIRGTPDMTPELTAVSVEEAGLTGLTLPTCSVAGTLIDNGDDAKCFASYMRIHALEATGGRTYAEMPQFATADGKGTSSPADAVVNPKTGKPESNPARQVWITETALATALNTSFFASSVGLFAIVVGIALILSGSGFVVLAAGLLGGSGLRLRRAMPGAPRPAVG